MRPPERRRAAGRPTSGSGSSRTRRPHTAGAQAPRIGAFRRPGSRGGPGSRAGPRAVWGCRGPCGSTRPCRRGSGRLPRGSQRARAHVRGARVRVRDGGRGRGQAGVRGPCGESRRGPRVHDLAVTAEQLRVVIAEDSALIREGVARLIEESGGTVVAKVGDGELFVAAVVEHRPEVSVVDVRMPPTQRDEGLRAAIEARRRVPGSPVLVLSQYVEREYASELLADGAGGVGYLLKDRVADVREFMDALRRVASGGTALDPEVVSQLMVSRRRDDRLAALTPREREVLAAMAEGRTNVGIASALVISEGAAEKHITSILGKLDLPDTENDHRRVLAVLAFLDAGG